MLDFLHDANDWLGSPLLFIILILAWLAAILFVADEIIGWFIKEDKTKKTKETSEDDRLF